MAEPKAQCIVDTNKWFARDQPDPVYEGMVKDFDKFHEALEKISGSCDGYMEGAKQLAIGMQALADGTAAQYACLRDANLRADSRRLQAVSRQVTLKDAPDSALDKFLRNLDFNIMAPIKEHLDNAEKIQKLMEKRQRRLVELREASDQVDECVRRNVNLADRNYQMAQQEFRVSRRHFDRVDGRLFEWLYILDEHRGDILDSSLQTLKYLQYEFFAQSAHALAQVLPDRMDFRPMSEMDPQHLQALLGRGVAGVSAAPPPLVVPPPLVATLGMVSSDTVARDVRFRTASSGFTFAADVGYAQCLAERLNQEHGSTSSGDAAPVDALSLCSLLAQGVEESQARRALRLHGNCTQAALEWLLRGARDDSVGTTAEVSEQRLRHSRSDDSGCHAKR